jgi:hypothetical protein
MIRFPGAIRGLANCKTHLYVGTDAGIFIVWGTNNFEVQRIDGNYKAMPGTMLAINGACYLATRDEVNDVADMTGIFKIIGDDLQPMHHHIDGLYGFSLENDGYNCEFQENRYYVIRRLISEINNGFHYEYLVYDVWLGGWHIDDAYVFSQTAKEGGGYNYVYGFNWKSNKIMVLEDYLKGTPGRGYYARDFGHLPKQIYKLIVEAKGEFIIKIYRDEESTPIKTIHKTFAERTTQKFYGSWRKGKNFSIEISGKDGTIIYAVEPIMITPSALSENTGDEPVGEQA